MPRNAQAIRRSVVVFNRDIFNRDNPPNKRGRIAASDVNSDVFFAFWAKNLNVFNYSEPFTWANGLCLELRVEITGGAIAPAIPAFFLD